MAATTSQFSTDFLEEVRKILTDKKLKLEAEIGGFAKKSEHVEDDYEADFPEYGNEDDENAREIADYTANKPLEMALEKELRDIDKALKRLDEGTYGVCKYCDAPIPEKRLLARPTSSSCVSCKKTLTNEA